MDEEKSVWFDAVDWCATDYLSMPDPVPTGLGGLDHCLGGGMRPGLYTVLGRPGEGKSALALSIATCSVSRMVGAVIVSLEMPAHDVWLRMASAWCTQQKDYPNFLWSDAQNSGRITVDYGGEHLASGQDPVITAATKMQGLPLMISEPEEPTIDAVVSLLRMGKASGARMGVVDYLQLIDVPGVEREHERVSAAVRALAQVARELELPIILVAAMNRDGMTGTASMHSAAGSSLVEYASTCVMTYMRDKTAADPAGTRTMLLNIEKNRSGMVTDEPLRLRYWPAFNYVETAPPNPAAPIQQ